MRILAIGGAGYIGSHVVKDLVKDGHQVLVFDDMSTGQEVNLFDEAEFVKGSILDYPALLNVMKNRVDAVIHLAAQKAVGESMENPEKYATNNIIGTINILNAMSEAGVKNIVFSSSAAVYGAPEYLPIDEKHPTRPMSFYGFTKLDIENYLEWYRLLKGINYVALRYFNAVGYDEDGDVKGLEINPQNLLPIVMEVAVKKRDKLKIFGNDYDTPDHTCIRDYIHVSDLAKAHTLSIKYLTEKKESQILNLGTEKGISVLEMVMAAEEYTKVKIPFEFVPRRAGDPAVVLASAEKAKKILGWEAKKSGIENLIVSTWKVYKDLV